MGIFDGCDTQTINLIECFEDNDCPVVAAPCAGQLQEFSQCFNPGGF